MKLESQCDTHSLVVSATVSFVASVNVLGRLSRQVVSAGCLGRLSRLVPGCPSCSPVLLGALETAWGPAETTAKTSAKTAKTSAKTTDQRKDRKDQRKDQDSRRDQI